MNQNQSFDTFSHEIKNTLTLIYGQLQYIEETNQDLLENKTWMQVKEDFSSLFSYLNHSFTPNTNIAATVECIDLVSLLKEVENSWSYQFQIHHIDFQFQNCENQSYYIYGSKTKLKQIFHNLISNALQAIEQKNIKNSPSFIHINLSKEGDYCVCSLSDSGIGMSKNQQERIFYRGVSFRPKGNGIGLHVVKELVSELQAEIHVDSQKNQGSTFTLIFPGIADTK
ncbi:MAG: HAMP domain-containing sensor histidine kinase [Anaerostipes sp.]|jgi:two-component system sensor histidine kinase HydH|nr:HAMP domain-containing sensor histidine kinase [Anaerostipes sp.]MDD3745919.1 HAMP domain-containing sensor histidine kinase [Anaerostipes sp.]